MDAGVLTVGRWTLTIHKNSHIDPATISMTVRDRQSMDVEILVTPASANVFQVPIELVANCSDQTNMVMTDQSIYFWNGDWEQATDRHGPGRQHAHQGEGELARERTCRRGRGGRRRAQEELDIAPGGVSRRGAGPRGTGVLAVSGACWNGSRVRRWTETAAALRGPRTRSTTATLAGGRSRVLIV
jgi:hypothetical protein